DTPAESDRVLRHAHQRTRLDARRRRRDLEQWLLREIEHHHCAVTLGDRAGEPGRERAGAMVAARVRRVRGPTVKKQDRGNHPPSTHHNPPVERGFYAWARPRNAPPGSGRAPNRPDVESITAPRRFLA